MPWSLCYNQCVEYKKKEPLFWRFPAVRNELCSEIRSCTQCEMHGKGKGVTYALYNDFGGLESQP